MIRLKILHVVLRLYLVAMLAAQTEPVPEPEPEPEPWEPAAEDVAYISRTIYGEARGCDKEQRQAVAWCILAQVEDPRFPSTVREVISAPRQYTTAYLGGFDRTPRECYEAAKIALDGESGVPEDVVWQANFPQGTEAWWISEVDTGWYRSTTYFCR